MKKIIIGMLVLFLALVLAVLAAAVLFLPSLVKTGVETLGPRLTKSSVTVDSIRFVPWRGSLAIDGLTVGNPEGFKSESAFTLGHVGVSLSPRSVLSRRVIISDILIDAPVVTYEFGPQGSNIAALQRNIEAFVGAAPTKSDTAGEGLGRAVEIERVRVTNGRIGMAMTALGGRGVTVPLRDITVTNIGTEREPSSMADAVSTVFSRLSGTITDVIADQGQFLRQGADVVGGAMRDAGKSAQDGAAKALEGVKGLLRRTDK